MKTPAELRRQVRRPDPSTINRGLVCPSADWMLAKFGKPGKLTTDCSDVTNPKLVAMIVTESVGPFRVTGHKAAVLGLRHVLQDVKEDGRTDLLANLRPDGMLCCRSIRGRKVFSNHAWGFAVDLNFGPGEEMGDGTVQQGLIDLQPFFEDRRWFSGMGYTGREDGMHFEPSVALIETWGRLGLL